MDKLYLAAPFFNDAQSTLVGSIEQMFKDAGAPLFSPRQNDENKKGPPSAESARLIFQRNIDELEQADGVLAVLDWLLPKGQEVRVVSSEHTASWSTTDMMPQYSHKAISPPLNLPDTGTVWEMGYAFKLGIPIAIYTERPPTQSLNLMLTQCAFGIINGPAALLRWVQDSVDVGEYRFDGLPEWKGGNR